jgi:hypothetical protein
MILESLGSEFAIIILGLALMWLRASPSSLTRDSIVEAENPSIFLYLKNWKPFSMAIPALSRVMKKFGLISLVASRMLWSRPVKLLSSKWLKWALVPSLKAARNFWKLSSLSLKE